MTPKRFLISRPKRTWAMRTCLLLLGAQLSHCGVKAAPTPLFDGPEDRFQSEIQARDLRRKPTSPPNKSQPPPPPPKKD